MPDKQNTVPALPDEAEVESLKKLADFMIGKDYQGLLEEVTQRYSEQTLRQLLGSAEAEAFNKVAAFMTSDEVRGLRDVVKNRFSRDSLRQFFGGGEVFRKKLTEFMTSDEYSELREEISDQLSTIKWPGAVTRIVEQADVLLDTPIGQTLVRAYSESGVLNKYLDPEQYDPEEVVVVELVEHTVTSRHEPHIDIVINEQPLGALRFVIDLKLAMKGLILKIQDAKIKELNPGTCKGSGKIVFYGRVLVEKESEEVTLLGPFDFGNGIPILP